MADSNIYRYFRNKQAIGHDVVSAFLEEETQLTSAAMAAPAANAEARLRAVVIASVRHTVDRLQEAPKIVELAEMICETEEGIAMIGVHVETCRQRLADIIADGVASGEFAVTDPDTAARAVQMGTKFFVVPFAIARHGLDRVDEDLAITLDLLCAGLRAR